MKSIAITLGIFLTQFAFGQKAYSESEVDKMAIYPTCEKAKDTAKCFSQKLSIDMSQEISDHIDSFEKGIYVARVNFTINEDGSITNISTQSDNDNFREKTTKSVEVLFAKNNLYNKTISPAQVNGENVNMNYSFPVRLHVQ